MLSQEPKSEVVTIRITSQMKERIEKLAQATRRTKSFLYDEAISSYLDANEWQVKAIQEALDEAHSTDAKWTAQEELETRYDID